MNSTWVVADREERAAAFKNAVVAKASGRLVAICLTPQDAALCAAAPDLRAALIRLLETPHDEGAVYVAKAALTLAEWSES
jgi:hypothetical protein